MRGAGTNLPAWTSAALRIHRGASVRPVGEPTFAPGAAFRRKCATAGLRGEPDPPSAARERAGVEPAALAVDPGVRGAGLLRAQLPRRRAVVDPDRAGHRLPAQPGARADGAVRREPRD